MKKLGLVISALALVLGMSQCTKKPNMPTMVGNYETKSITFSTTSNGGQKGEFNDALSALNYVWNVNDKIHVYVTTVENDDNFENGQYCGVLDLVDGEETTDAVFYKKGMLIPQGAKKIRFVHVGQGLNVADDGDSKGASDMADFSTQDGVLSNLSNKVIALYPSDIREDGIYENCPLLVQFAVAKLKFTGFAAGDVAVKGMVSNGLKVEKTGKITYNTTTENTSFIAPSSDFYAVLMPKESTQYTFGNAGGTASKTWTINPNMYYYQGNLEIEATEIESPTVNTYFGCDGVGIFNYGGEVEPKESQTCEFGIVYSTESTEPTVSGANCTKEVVANEALSAKKSFSIDVVSWDESKTTYVRAYVIGENLVPVYGEISTIDNGVAKPLPASWTNGENPHPFTVASGKVVHFSQGGLQWSAQGSHTVIGGDTRPGTWRFANHQFDMLGVENVNIDQAYMGWIDLFGWGTSGYYPNEQPEDRRAPYRYDGNSSTYGNGNCDLDYNLDWGRYNDISNDGSYSYGVWRTLSEEEWKYLTKASVVIGGDTKNIKEEVACRDNAEQYRGFATIGGCTHGLVILPDDWAGSAINYSLTNWDDNQFTHPQWRNMEENGAIFLPANGARDIKVYTGGNDWGVYWTTTATEGDDKSAQYLDYSPTEEGKLYVGYYERARGRSVRVVRDVTSK